MHFRPDFEPFVRQKDWKHQTLGETNFAAAVAADFLFKKTVQRPFEVVAEILGEEKPHLNGVGKRFVFTEEFLRFTFRQRLGRSLVVQNIADAEFVLDEKGGIKRDLVPIGERVAAFDAEGPFLRVSPE